MYGHYQEEQPKMQAMKWRCQNPANMEIWEGDGKYSEI